MDIAVSDDDESFDDKSDVTYKPPMLDLLVNNDIESTTNLNKEKRYLLNEFLRLCGSNKEIKITNSYDTLQKQSKANFIGSARHLIHHIIDFLSSNKSINAQRDILMVNNGNSS